jgi:hypothetical protein
VFGQPEVGAGGLMKVTGVRAKILSIKILELVSVERGSYIGLRRDFSVFF